MDYALTTNETKKKEDEKIKKEEFFKSYVKRLINNSWTTEDIKELRKY
jgi:hypothetical protein